MVKVANGDTTSSDSSASLDYETWGGARDPSPAEIKILDGGVTAPRIAILVAERVHVTARSTESGQGRLAPLIGGAVD